MNEMVYAKMQKKMQKFCLEIMGKLAENCADNYEEFLEMWQEMHELYLNIMAQNLQQWAEKDDQQGTVVDKLEANEAVVEFLDKNTGKLFRRKLPINCLETANGIVLSGETMDGQSSKIAFLSESALHKINDLVGKGADTPHHNHH